MPHFAIALCRCGAEGGPHAWLYVDGAKWVLSDHLPRPFRFLACGEVVLRAAQEAFAIPDEECRRLRVQLRATGLRQGMSVRKLEAMASKLQSEFAPEVCARYLAELVRDRALTEEEGCAIVDHLVSLGFFGRVPCRTRRMAC